MTTPRKSTIRGLVLTRRIGDQVVINHGEVLLEVVDIKGKSVRLAFQAPGISIQRGEACKIEK